MVHNLHRLSLFATHVAAAVPLHPTQVGMVHLLLELPLQQLTIHWFPQLFVVQDALLAELHFVGGALQLPPTSTNVNILSSLHYVIFI